MTKRAGKLSWAEANQRSLAAEFLRLKEILGARPGTSDLPPEPAPARKRTPPARKPTPKALQPPVALDRLADLFGLSRFERDVLLLAAGVEMDSAIAAACPRVTFGLALAALNDPHWSALSPSGALRRYRLIDFDPGHGLTGTPLRIDERILHYLAGLNFPDPRLAGLVTESAFPDWIAEPHKAVAGQLASILGDIKRPAPPLQLCGDDPQGQEDAAALAASQAGLRLFTLRADDVPPAGPELDQFMALWERDARLLTAALLVVCGGSGLPAAARHLAERLRGVVILAIHEPAALNRAFLRFDIDKPRPAEQRRLWQDTLGAAASQLNGALDDLSEQFRLSARAIRSTGTLLTPHDGQIDPVDLWNACRGLARPRLENLAHRIVSAAAWDDLVLPEQQMRTLRHLLTQVRHRMKVYETWGFSAKGRRGLGVSALFTGESGTGKTLAAEVLAHELALDLYRIDLSAVVSKYIGETEKNLRQVFDAAEDGGALLLFDEADALFGKRGDVKDSHDRYANIEVGYLLQRMESYQGLAILTTNLKSALDKSFQRRLRFTINFPFPDAVQREAIWRRAFPPGTPTQGLDAGKLAQFKVPGGNIRNIALNAAFLAAATDGRVGMRHLLEAAALEAEKIERPLSQLEVKGWT